MATLAKVFCTVAVDRPTCSADAANLLYDSPSPVNDWPANCAVLRRNSICLAASVVLPVTVVSTRRICSSAISVSMIGRATMPIVPMAAPNAPNRVIRLLIDPLMRSNGPATVGMVSNSRVRVCRRTCALLVARARSSAPMAPIANLSLSVDRALLTLKISARIASSERTPVWPNAASTPEASVFRRA